ncbi:MAG: BolA/IbaG family iron-sulfur metabolism protein [Neisseriaceae bacterium]|nr:BolA/IbaG family iron-sulfur metabolism protein [Neisseriaceae bacterium]
MNTSELKQLINNELSCTHLKIDGDGRHFFMEIVSEAFIGKTRIARHRLIKDKLKHLIASDELHAISITMAKTPEEWKTY